MNLVIAHSAQIAFAVSRALNCTDRTENGDYTNDTGSIVITSVAPDFISPAPIQAYANGSDFIKTLPFIPKGSLMKPGHTKISARFPAPGFSGRF